MQIRCVRGNAVDRFVQVPVGSRDSDVVRSGFFGENRPIASGSLANRTTRPVDHAVALDNDTAQPTSSW